MNKVIHLAALATLTFGVPLALQPAFHAADTSIQMDAKGHGGHGHHSGHPHARSADFKACLEDQPCWDCRYDGNRVCGQGSGQAPGWYGDDDCWPAAIWCPDIDGPYDPAKIHPGATKLHTWTGEDGIDLGPSILASGSNAWDDGAYVGGWN